MKKLNDYGFTVKKIMDILSGATIDGVIGLIALMLCCALDEIICIDEWFIAPAYMICAIVIFSVKGVFKVLSEREEEN